MKRKPTTYDRGQHELICGALKISPDPAAPGPTAYEGVCVLITKINAAIEMLSKNKGIKAKEMVKFLKKKQQDFPILQMF